MGEAEKVTSHVCPALCALRLGEPSDTANAPLLPSLSTTCVWWGGISISVRTYRMLLCGGECLSCNSVSISPSKKSREVMEVGEAAAAAW